MFSSRFIKVFALFAALCLIITSCRQENKVSCALLLSAIEDCFGGTLPVCKTVYKKSASQYSREFLSPSLASLIYYGQKRESLYELSLLSDYTLRLADGQSGAEIHVLKVRARSDMDTVEKMVLRRLDYIQNRQLMLYIPQSYPVFAEQATVFSKGNYIFLLATPDNQLAIDTLCRLI